MTTTDRPLNATERLEIAETHLAAFEKGLVCDPDAVNLMACLHGAHSALSNATYGDIKSAGLLPRYDQCTKVIDDLYSAIRALGEFNRN